MEDHYNSREFLRKLALLLGALTATPLLVPYLFTNKRLCIREDVQSWIRALKWNQNYYPVELLVLLSRYPEFRSLYFHRLRYGSIFSAFLSILFRFLYRGQIALYLNCVEIGSGLFLQHAFSTTIGAERIGKNCWINQQVTIGYRDETRAPIIGNNVTIYAGAKVLGPILIGDHVTIGANAVVVKDVPDHCVVVGVPAYIVRRHGIKTKEPL